MRLFVAVHFSQDVRTRLALIQDRLRLAQADVSWVKPANLHLTLKFLGETEPKRLERIHAALAEAAADARPFSARVTGVGTFGGRVPRVVWAGVTGGVEPLVTLARAVENGLAQIGFPKEKRGFTAHLTLGRVRSSRNVESLLAALRDEPPEDFGTLSVDRFALMQSELNPAGSMYTELEWFYLRAT
jgi:RNA 2',3'-cyclic 3'-phosphodiesterase